MGEAGRLISDRGLRTSTSPTDSNQSRGGLSRNWDDGFVLKHQLPALIPAFDPRPGRTNVNQVSFIVMLYYALRLVGCRCLILYNSCLNFIRFTLLSIHK